MQRFCQIVLFLLVTWGAENMVLSEVVSWDNTSTETGNLWSNPENWSTRAVPTTGDTVKIANGGTVDLGNLSDNTRLYDKIELSNGSIIANAPEVESNFMIMENSFTMTGGSVDINVRRFLLGTNGSSESTISGGNFKYRHDGGDREDGSMRVGSLWGQIVPSEGTVASTLNIQGDAMTEVERMIVGFGGWNLYPVSGKVVIENTATLALGANMANSYNPNITEYSMVLGHLSNGAGEVIVKDSGTLTTQGRISIAQQGGEGMLALHDSGTVKSVQLRTGAKGRYLQTGGTAEFSGDFMINSVKNKHGKYGMVVTGGSLSVDGTMYIGMYGGHNAAAYVSEGAFDVKALQINGSQFYDSDDTTEGKSVLTIDGAKSTWNVRSFQMSGSLAGIEFLFGKGGYATIESTTSSLGGGSDVSAMFDIERIHIVKDKYYLITADKMTNSGADLYHNTDYWTIHQEGMNIVLDLVNYYDGLPYEKVSEGVVKMTEPSDSFKFYSDILDPEAMQDFLDWLEESEDVVSAVSGPDGSVIVKFAEEIDHFAFNFDMFNKDHPGNQASLTGTIPTPEPATWGMLLLGLGLIYMNFRSSRRAKGRSAS
ncbi:MAG: PEP-CTERM sorting domain-containing protein [Planctomycetia bacterium]|nr:PEP-CTERM sorting domain-containing protein [Planctomycetia bacterium]